MTMAYHLPLDPTCRENPMEGFFEDPMTAAYGMGEMAPMVEANHRKACEQCRLYGVANIEVEGP